MSAGLPRHIDPWRLAGEGRQLQGKLPLALLSRLQESCVGPAKAEVDVDLGFAALETGEARIYGHLAVTVVLSCQRCLEPMEVALEAHVDVLALRQEAAHGSLAQSGEGLVLVPPVLLSELVEDELLLALPMLPRHAQEQCVAAQYLANPGAPEGVDGVSDDATTAASAKAEQQAPNPFAVLRQWRNKD